MMSRASKMTVGLALATAISLTACVQEIDAIGSSSGIGGSNVGSAAVGVGGGPTSVVSSTSGAFPQGPCGFFEDHDACTVDTSTMDVLDQVAATTALVGTWRRCDVTAPGTFDVGVRLQTDGRAYRLYRRPNDVGGTSTNVVYCGGDMSDGGNWLVQDKSAQGLPDEYDLTVQWDNGDVATFDFVFFDGQTGLGIYDTPDAVAPMLFAPEGPAI